MSFNPSFVKGHTYSNDEISSEFKCGNMGGMRRSRNTNSLILISDHTKGLYDDKWYGDILHYTGMGKTGNQSLDFMQNKTLAQSPSNDVAVFLFEVMEPKQYIFLGRVKLTDNPYQEQQRDEDGQPRNVWMFPLRLVDGIIPIEASLLEKQLEQRKKQAKKLPTEELYERVKAKKRKQASRRAVQTTQYSRDPDVAEYAKRRANGICQLCEKQAPFKDKNDDWFLVTHHIIWLSREGEDSIQNTVALCPNCHAKMHALGRPQDVEKLLQKVKE